MRVSALYEMPKPRPGGRPTFKPSPKLREVWLVIDTGEHRATDAIVAAFDSEEAADAYAKHESFEAGEDEELERYETGEGRLMLYPCEVGSL